MYYFYDALLFYLCFMLYIVSRNLMQFNHFFNQFILTNHLIFYIWSQMFQFLTIKPLNLLDSTKSTFTILRKNSRKSLILYFFFGFKPVYQISAHQLNKQGQERCALCAFLCTTVHHCAPLCTTVHHCAPLHTTAHLFFSKYGV